jgi:hypothetical protein
MLRLKFYRGLVRGLFWRTVGGRRPTSPYVKFEVLDFTVAFERQDESVFPLE